MLAFTVAFTDTRFVRRGFTTGTKKFTKMEIGCLTAILFCALVSGRYAKEKGKT